MATFGQPVRISGFVRDSSSREALSNVSVVVEEAASITQSNSYGFYALSLQKGRNYTVTYSRVGYRGQTIEIMPVVNRELDIQLVQTVQMLAEVDVSATDDRASRQVQMSSISLTAEQIKQVPALLGEKDVLKALQLLPGVQQGAEGSSVFYVRGGGADQNLILLDNATVYNANHLFGFFSTFNTDAIKRVELFKGGFPARYGGRLSSIVDIQLKEGNRERIHGEGGIGLLASRLTLEGPIVKNKVSFLLSARRTYADALLRLIQPATSQLTYRFYDLNGKLNWTLNRRNSLYVSVYTGDDLLQIKESVNRSASAIDYRNQLKWGNTTSSLRWNYLVNSRLFSNVTLTHSIYRFGLTDFYQRIRRENTYSTDAAFASTVRDWTLKVDMDYYKSLRHSIKWGGAWTLYRFQPRAVSNKTIQEGVEQVSSATEAPVNTVEAALYAESQYQFSPKFTLNSGLRLSYYKAQRRTYWRPEPRLALAYRLTESLALKAAYSRMNQYVHQLSNTGAGLPTDLWVPATDAVPAQTGDQLALGIARDFGATYSLTTDVYYKWMRGVINYKSGANFLGIGEDLTAEKLRWENDVTSGRGWAYGLEVLAQKKRGRLTGWVGYTLSWSIRQFAELNGGKPFYARQDRRHDLKIVETYQLSPKIRLSASWQFNSGTALTVPQAVYINPGSDVGRFSPFLYYGQYNGFRTPAYHRLDASIQFVRQKRWGERSWEFSVFNLYNRRNIYYYSIIYQYEPSTKLNYYGLDGKWLLPVLPSISYNFKF